MERISHPAIKAPEYKCFRVLRRFKTAEGLDFEDIGKVKTVAAALEISIHEIGYAVVLDPNNKQVSYNGQPMETRA